MRSCRSSFAIGCSGEFARPYTAKVELVRPETRGMAPMDPLLGRSSKAITSVIVNESQEMRNARSRCQTNARLRYSQNRSEFAPKVEWRRPCASKLQDACAF